MGAVHACHGSDSCVSYASASVSNPAACGRCRHAGDRDTEELDPPVAELDQVLDALVPASSSEAQPQQCPYVLPAAGQLTVLLFGMTGSGKSSLGNLIAGSDVFGAGDTTRSVTNLDSITRYEASDDSLIVLDSIGLGDTDINQENVCASIRAVAASAPHGVDMFLYVMHIGRMTDDSVARLIYLTQYLWGDESLLNLYIVMTWASRYVHDRRAAEEWIQTQVDADPRFRHIYALVGNNPSRFIFIENPPGHDGDRWQQVLEDQRRLSRELMFKAFCEHPRDLVNPFVSSAVPQSISQRLLQESNALQEKRLEVARIEDALNREADTGKKAAKGAKAGEVNSGSSQLNFRQLLRDSAGEEQEGSQKEPQAPKVVNDMASKASEAKAKKRSPKRAAAKEKSPRASKDSNKDASTPRSEGKSSTQSPVSEQPKKANGHDQKELQVALEKAKDDLEESKKKVDSAMEQMKADKDFQKNVDRTVAESTKKFQDDFAAADAGKKEKTSRARGLWKSMSRTVFSMKKSVTASKEEKFEGLMTRSASRLRATASPVKACIIFDWDDTLCPTYWLQRVLEPSVGHVPEGSYQQDLSAFVQQLEVVLRTACNIAHVDILTQSNVYWVKQSLEYLRLSGMDIEAVLNDLGVRFHYSDIVEATAAKSASKSKSSLDVLTLAKKISMVKILQSHFGDSPKANWNTLSIGDRYIELDALREVCKERQRRTWRRPICKTVKLPEEPQLEDLGRTLHVLAPQLEPLVAKEKDLDAVFNSSSNTLTGF